MVIDFHTHAFPDALAPRAISQLAERADIKPETDGTVSSFLSRMDDWGIDRAVVCNIATNARQMDNVNRFADETNKTHGDRLTALWSVHPDAETALDTLEQAKAAGVPGIKLHPDYMGYDFDDPVYDPTLDLCSQLGLFIIIHAGFDVHCILNQYFFILTANFQARHEYCFHFQDAYALFIAFLIIIFGFSIKYH